MTSIAQALGIAALAGVILLAPGRAVAEPAGGGSVALRRAEETVAQLRAELARVNVEVAELKRGTRSLRNDYRLRERMADAEALAKKLIAAEANVRTLGGGRPPASTGAPLVAPPPVSPQDGNVELEAKADLLADQARKLDEEADVLAKAAEQLRSRKAMRRKAGSWERDPFAGLETSRRNIAATPVATKYAAGSSGASSGEGSREGATSANPTSAPTLSITGGSATPPPSPTVPVALAPGSAATDSTTKAATSSPASDGTSAMKSSPLPLLAASDRQAGEHRLYLDPATAAELRQALGAGGAALDPAALERGAATLRARAQAIAAQARALRTQTRAP
jgi:hypothetical protein